MFHTSIIKNARSVATTRYFSAAACRMAAGSTGSGSSRPTGSAGGDAFTKREAAAEELFIRQQEKEKLLAIKDKLAQQSKHIADLDKHIDDIINEGKGQGEQK